MAEDPIDRAVRVLNEINEADPLVLPQLIEHRIACNDALAAHPTVQVGAVDGGGFEVGLLGIINGLFGVDEEQWGFIGAVSSDGGHTIERFEKRTIGGEFSDG